jgi:hypothetical protein
MAELINGKYYPLLSQFVDRKSEFIGGILEDLEEGPNKSVTEINDIKLIPNGKDSAFFRVCGKDFDCGFDTEVGGVVGGEEGWITFHGYGGHEWRIREVKR